MSNYSFWSPTLSHSCWQPTYQTELYHFGVKGMRWGVRHDKETLGGRNKPRGGREHYELFRDTDSVAAVANFLSRSVSGLKVGESLHWANLLKGAGVTAAKIKANEFRTSKLQTDPKTGLKLKDPNKKYTAEEDMKAVNPGHQNYLSTGSRNNCMLCTMAFDLRRRGYDVSANFATYGYTFDDLKYWYPGCTQSFQELPLYSDGNGHYSYDEEDMEAYIDNTIEDLIATGEGSRGALNVFWMGGGGHSMAYEIHNGKPIIYDCQTGRIEDAREILKNTVESHAVRLDNIEPNAEYIKEVTHDNHSKKRR